MLDLRNGGYLQYNKPSLLEKISKIEWIDNYSEERLIESVEALMELGAFYHEILLSLMDYEWMSDSVSEDEANVILMVLYLGHSDKFAARRVAAMPFLESLEPADLYVLLSLGQMAAFRKSEFDQVMAHPSLSEGIVDAHSPIIATLNGVSEVNPDLIDTLLDQSRTTIERRTISLPRTGEVDLTITRTGLGAERSMDLLEHAVRTSETLMGEPLPTKYVGLLFENAVFGEVAGTNFGTHIAIRPRYDVDDGSRHAQFAGKIIAHEVAHFYWWGNADWVDEGVADFMASAIDSERTGAPVGVIDQPCPYFRTISELTSIQRQSNTPAFKCNYSIGSRFFMDLYYSLGRDQLWTGILQLYKESTAYNDPYYRRRGVSLTVEEVREAFGTEAPVSTAIARWRDGTESYDISRLDLSDPDPALPDVNGQIDGAYITLDPDGPLVSTFKSRDATGAVWFQLDYSYSVTGAPREVAFEIVQFYEDGFSFARRKVALTASPEYVGGTSWYYLGSGPLAVGRYWVYVYDGDRKVAEAQYEVTR